MSKEPSFSHLVRDYNEASRRLADASVSIATWLKAGVADLRGCVAGDSDFVAKLDRVEQNISGTSIPAPELTHAAYTLASVAAHLQADPARSNNYWNLMQDLGMFGRAALPTDRPEWRGEDVLPGKTLVVTCADGQGVGDTFQLPGLLREVKKKGFAGIHLEVQPSLLNTLQGLPHTASVFAKGAAFPQHDMHCSLMRLPALLGVKLQDFRADSGYIAVPSIPAEHAAWIAENITDYKGGPVIALAWKGDPKNRLEIEGRGMELHQLEPLLRMPAARFVSLQFGPGSEQVAQLPDELKDKFITMPRSFDPGKEGWGFRDTLAVMAACNAVVSTDTSIIHAAGAVKARGYAMLQHIPEARWCTKPVEDSAKDRPALRIESAWYPSVTQIMQVKEGDWSRPAALVAEAIERAATPRRPLPGSALKAG